MPEDVMVPAGNYKVRKRFRNEEHRRKKKDMPWSKQILDLDENRLFGRTAWAWCRIVSFYLLLYLLIFLIVTSIYFTFRYCFIVSDKPNILKAAPGLSIVPSNVTTISFYPNQMTDVYPICDRIDDFLEKLDEDAISYFEDCNSDKLWGYSVKKPCFFVKLNSVYGFQAETYDSIHEIPSDCPSQLSNVMAKYKGGNRIWLTCETVSGPSPKLAYYPGPYYDTEELVGVSRVVAVQMTEVPENEEMMITCQVWAKNIEIDTTVEGIGNAQIRIKMNIQHSEKTLEEMRLKPLKYKVRNRFRNDQDHQNPYSIENNLEIPPLPDLEPEDDDENISHMPTEPPANNHDN